VQRGPMRATHTALCPLLVLVFGCGDAMTPDRDAAELDTVASVDSTAPGDTSPDEPRDVATEVGLPRVHQADPERAERGARVLDEAWPGRGVIPALALRHLYLSRTTDLAQIYGFYSDTARYRDAFSARYGVLYEAGDALPTGFVASGDGAVSVTCLLCHAGRSPGGDRIVGLPNARLDLQGLHDDLMALPAAFEALKQRPLPEPYASLVASIPVPAAPPPLAPMSARTGAAGATDAMGLGIAFAALAAGREDVETRFGFQTPAPWWTTAYKPRRYADGSVAFGGHRMMMATLLGLGFDPGQLAALDDDFAAVEHYLVTLEPPAWPFEAPDPTLVALGRALFGDHCASCHGTYEGAHARYPDRVVPVAEIGTDPGRVDAFGPDEEALVASLVHDPAHPMRRTGGYLAPPLSGIWASAPYLHNGAIPDLLGVLDSRARPARWRRTGDGAEHYDRERVGWRFEEVSGDPPSDTPPPTIEARTIVETSQPGLSNAGHRFGDDLDDEARRALLAYLKTL
jgi:mono/diheme cytochrome c family protein